MAVALSFMCYQLQHTAPKQPGAERTTGRGATGGATAAALRSALRGPRRSFERAPQMLAASSGKEKTEERGESGRVSGRVGESLGEGSERARRDVQRTLSTLKVRDSSCVPRPGLLLPPWRRMAQASASPQQSPRLAENLLLRLTMQILVSYTMPLGLRTRT